MQFAFAGQLSAVVRENSMEIGSYTETMEEDDRLAVSSIFEEGWKYAYRGIVPQNYSD